MKPEEQNIPPTDPQQPQPVAYDAEGRALYHHPPEEPAPQATQPMQNQAQPAPQQPLPQNQAQEPQRLQPLGPPPPVPPENAVNQSPQDPGQQAPQQPSDAPSSYVKSVDPSLGEGHNFDPQIRAQYANEPNVVHASRAIDVAPRTMSEELRKRHEDSKRKYPNLNLSEGEYVILSVTRHPIGMLAPAAATGGLLMAIGIFIVLYPTLAENVTLDVMPSFGTFLLAMIPLALLVILGGAIALWVYLQNQLYLTNESIIQEIQRSLFVRREQTVSLGSVEDASFKQAGILQTILDYGNVRLSTEGDETTYRFEYVGSPRRQVAILNNAVEAFKNGRPVPDDPNPM